VNEDVVQVGITLPSLFFTGVFVLFAYVVTLLSMEVLVVLS
jgi:hypothetical protein